MNIPLIEDPDAALRECVHRELRTHNQRASPEFWVKRDLNEHAPNPVNLFAFTPDGEVAGGLFGSTQLSWLKVDIMATRSDYRGQGVGRALLARAERIAMERGCLYSYVDTMDHQAPGFYSRSGYHLVGTLDDWDSHGHAKHLFMKVLSRTGM